MDLGTVHHHHVPMVDRELDDLRVLLVILRLDAERHDGGTSQRHGCHGRPESVFAVVMVLEAFSNAHCYLERLLTLMESPSM